MDAHTLHLLVVWTIGVTFVLVSIGLWRAHRIFTVSSKVAVLAALVLQPIIQQFCFGIWESAQTEQTKFVLFILAEIFCCASLGYLMLDATLFRGRREKKVRLSYQRIQQDTAVGMTTNVANQ